MRPAIAAFPDGPTKRSNFGVLRLFLAYLVILSHSPELLDGNRSREILTRLFGTLSFGELAVDCFFIISGYLITSSYRSSSSGLEYMVKRVLRIYPGYIIAFALCVFALAPWVGGAYDAYWVDLSKDSFIASVVLLRMPMALGAFAGAHYPLLNGAVWTIRYEFLAYLVVLAAGTLGFLSKRWAILGITVVDLCANALLHLGPHAWVPGSLQLQLLPFAVEIRFLGLFASGSLFYLFHDKIVYNGRSAAFAVTALIALMFSGVAAEAAVATFGAYLLFYFAWQVRSEQLSRIGEKTDLSYGVYLYAWPIQATFVWLYPTMSPWTLFAFSSITASLFAFASWVVVERPAMKLKDLIKSKTNRRASANQR